jgi:putative flippase GtrA
MISAEARRELAAPLLRILANPAARQLLRYAFAGFCVTQLAALVYSGLVYAAHMLPLRANVASTAFGLCIGYVVHDRWSFAGGSAKDEPGKVARFLVTSGVALSVNSAWVWLLVNHFQLSPLAPVPMMMFVTPWVSFFVNRHWVFKAA